MVGNFKGWVSGVYYIFFKYTFFVCSQILIVRQKI